MTRLPKPGGDDNEWGGILNGFLSVAHNPDGTLQDTGIIADKADDNSVIHNSGNETVAGTKTFNSSPVVPSPTLGSQVANKTYVDATASSATPDADATTKGKVQLAGDLGGTAAAPTVPGLAGKYAKPAGGIPKTDLDSAVQASLTTADSRDAIKLQGTAVNGSAPSDNQILQYSQAANAWVPSTATSTTVTDATTTTKGIVQLAGDLGGTASAPTVPGLAAKQDSLGFTAENVANKDADGTLAANSDTRYPTQKATKTYVDARLTSGAANGGGLRAADFGVMMDGTDETTKIQTAITAAQTQKKVLHFQEGTTLVTAPLVLDQTKDLHLRGAGKGLTVFLHSMDDTMFMLAGSVAAATTITAAVAVGDQTITVASTSGLAKGDMVYLRDLTNPVVGSQGPLVGDPVAVGGEQMQIREIVSGTVLKFYGKLCWPYTTAADVRKKTSIRASFKDFSIENPSNTGDSSNARGIYLRYCTQSVVENVETKNMAGTSIYIWGGFLDRVINCSQIAGQDVEQEEKGLGPDGKPQGPYPYFVYAGRGTSHLLVQGCTMQYGRHLFTTAASPTEIPAQHIKLSDCVSYGAHHAHFDTHPGSRWVTFDNCQAVSGSTDGIYDTDGDTDATRLRAFGYGFQLRGPDQHVINCQARGMICGVFFANTSSGSVVGGRFELCDIGLRVRNCNDIRFGGGIVILEPELDGIYFEDIEPAWVGSITKLDIDDVVVIGNPSGSALTFQDNAWQPGFRITSRFRAPQATRKTSGITSLPTITAASTIEVPA